MSKIAPVIHNIGWRSGEASPVMRTGIFFPETWKPLGGTLNYRNQWKWYPLNVGFMGVKLRGSWLGCGRKDAGLMKSVMKLVYIYIYILYTEYIYIQWGEPDSGPKNGTAIQDLEARPPNSWQLFWAHGLGASLSVKIKVRAGRWQLTLIIQLFFRLVATCCEDAGFTVYWNYWNKKREQHWNHWITPLGVLACSSGSVFASERDLGQALCGYHGNPDLAHKAWNTQVGLYDLYIPKSS